MKPTRIVYGMMAERVAQCFPPVQCKAVAKACAAAYRYERKEAA